jgi:hypothetical protein
MKTSSIAALVAVAIVGATAAWAQTAPEAPKGPPGKHAEHSRMAPDPQRAKNFCADRYARAAGHMAYLEAKLDLNATQKPLFAKWEQSVMGSAQKNRDTCVANVAIAKPDVKPTIIDREVKMEAALSARLDAMKAQRPALEAFYAALTPDQQAQFNQPFGGHHGGHRSGDDRGPGGDDHRMHRM